jgi:glycosyltransferase involved in cell wall biosynthesis
MNLAIFSPNQNPYSETFIQAHKNHIRTDSTHYIYGRNLNNLKMGDDEHFITLNNGMLSRLSRKLTKTSNASLTENLIVKRLKELRIDVILIEYGTHAMHLLPALKKADIPFVVHFHGSDASIKYVLKKHNNYKELFEFANSVIVVSTVMHERFLGLGCPDHKLVYNVYGANPIFKKRSPQFLKKQALAIGRFVDKKAPYYTILAFKQVVEKHPEAQLIMAGQGVLWPTCKNLVRYLDLDTNIQLVGVVTPEEVAHFMEESYCFVQHSITAEDGDQEGTPLAVLEAALSGIPVVATYHAGIPDVIEHERTGLLCQEHDVDAMAENLIRIFDDVDFAKQLGKVARETHSIKFSLDRHIQSLEHTLEKARSL